MVAAMNADQRDRAAQLAAYYAATPSQISRRLGISFEGLCVAFDQIDFIDLVRHHEGRLVQHALDHLYEVDLPTQSIKHKMAEASHKQRVSLARDICVRLPPHHRWPS